VAFCHLGNIFSKS